LRCLYGYRCYTACNPHYHERIKPVLFQFPHPILTTDHQERLSAAITTVAPAVNITFFPPFGLHVVERPIGSINPRLIKPVQEVLAVAAATWDGPQNI